MGEMWVICDGGANGLGERGVCGIGGYVGKE